jgi:4-hydroxyacetophenone monooxygenase
VGFEVLIIGAGVSGLCAGINLKNAGIPFTILEKSATLGGIWRDNRYPGAGVDTPNHLYSFNNAPYDWSMYYALRDELHAYLEHVAAKFDLKSHIRFETEVESAAYEPANQRWKVDVRNADGPRDTLEASVVISAVGIFNPIKMPAIKGLDRFAGTTFHTAQWPADLDLTGKRVAMIGNGASAMQVGPKSRIPWPRSRSFSVRRIGSLPTISSANPSRTSCAFCCEKSHSTAIWYRLRLGWTFGDRLHSALQKDPTWEHADRSMNKANDSHRGYFTQYIASELGDRTELLDEVVPTYPPFGKRMLMDNGWYRMLRNEKVKLVSDPIAEIGPDRIITKNGTEYARRRAGGCDRLRRPEIPHRLRSARALRQHPA